MTSDFTPLAQSLQRGLTPAQLHELCWSLLSLTRSRAPWLKERWRSYLSHLCAIRSDSTANLDSLHPSREQLTTLLAHLLLITPLEQRPCERELNEWLDRWPARPSIQTLMEYCVSLECIYITEWINL